MAPCPPGSATVVSMVFKDLREFILLVLFCNIKAHYSKCDSDCQPFLRTWTTCLQIDLLSYQCWQHCTLAANRVLQMVRHKCGDLH